MSYGYVTPTNGFTVELWFNHAALPTYSEVLLSQQSQNKGVTWSTSPAINGRQFVVYLNQTSGALVLQMHDNAGNSIANYIDPAGSPAYGNDGAWHHVVLRLGTDRRTVKLWLDGVVVYQTTTLSVINWVPGVLAIGGTYAPWLGNFGTFLYNGGMAFVGVSQTAWTDAKILMHYAAGSGGSVFYNDSEVTRLGRLFDYCGVPVGARQFESSTTNLQAIKIAGQNGLSSVKGAAAAASGLVFADGQGVMVYQNKRHRYNGPIRATLTEETSSAPDVGMALSTDDTKVYNDVRASRPDGGSARLRNKASEDEYGPRVYELSLPITSDDQMRNAGTWIVERYGEDRVRVSGVALSAESSDLIQELAETVSIGDRVAFDDLPNNVPDSYLEFIVEGIGMDVSFKDQTWSLTLELSPADLWNVLQVGVSTLGDGSRIAF